MSLTTSDQRVCQMTIAKNIIEIRQRMERAASESGLSPAGIALVAAAKTKPPESIQRAIAAGADAIGENRVQEMIRKNASGAYEGGPLHFIGHLQRNKVKDVVGTARLIQSVDRIPLLRSISQRAGELGITQDILIEINIAGEDSKSGIPPEQLPVMLDAAAALGSIQVRGLMSIPPISTEVGSNRGYFSRLYQLFVDIGTNKYDNVSMDFLSMGMSADYEDAIREGSNMVRIGTGIFGARESRA